MKNRRGLSLFWALIVVVFTALHCSDRSPMSPGSIEGNGHLKLDLRLSKGLGPAIDKITVVAEHASMEPVKGKLTITNRQATGSLEVPAGTGWVVTVEGFIGDVIYYRGKSTPINVVAGQTVSVPTIIAKDLTPSIEVLKPDGTETVDERFVITWEDEDIDSNAMISLFYDRDNAGHDGDPISGAEALMEDDERNSFPWDTSTLPEGKYYVYSEINDGVHPPKYAYSPGPLTVSHPKADLVAEEVFITWVGENQPIDPNSLVEGDEVALTLSYRNAGSADAAGWRFEVYIDGALAGYLDDVSRPATETGTLWYKWTATEGSHTVEFRLDTGDVVKEEDEANNSKSLPFTVQPKVDLVAEEVFITWPGENEPIDPNSLTEGDEVDLNVMVRNTASFDVTGWQSSTYIDGEPYSYGENHPVEANSTTIIFIGWMAVAGPHTVTFTVDTGDVVRESDETNNTKSLTFTVQPSGFEVDLVAEEVFITWEGETEPIDPNSLVDGDEVVLNVMVRNTASVAVTGWRIEVYVDDILLDSGILSRDPHSTDREWFIWTATEGRHNIRFLLDTENVIRETDEGNNTARLDIVVRPPGTGGGIIAGQSVDGVEIGFTREQVIGTFGEPSDINEEGSFFYDRGTIRFDASGRVRFILVVPPYPGTTERGIGFGAPAFQIEEEYGTDYAVEPLAGRVGYWYRNLGIAFMLDESDVCVGIAIFPVGPPEPGGGIVAGQSVEGVEIGFGKVRVRATLGDPDDVDEDGDFSYNSGIEIWFDEDGRVEVILVTPPYPGATERGIGRGAPAFQIEEEYGTDYAVKILEGFPTYWYGNLGIAFILNESDVCISIAIFSPSMGIVAGWSVEGVEIGFTEQQVRDTLGPPDEIDEDEDFSYDSGIDVWFDESRRGYMILVMDPYSGTTERGIGLGSMAFQIEEKYGPDYTVEILEGFPTYWYGNLGIAFILNENDVCFGIVIFRPSAAKTALSHTDTMERLQRGISPIASEIKLIHPDFLSRSIR